MPRWAYVAGFLFVVFLVYNDPTQAGAVAGGFGAFVIELLGALGAFIVGLFGGESQSPVRGSGLPALDQGQLPEIYSGHSVDLDGDGLPELALFGDPSSPTLHELTTPPPPLRDTTLGFVAVLAVPAILKLIENDRFRNRLWSLWAKPRDAKPEPQITGAPVSEASD